MDKMLNTISVLKNVVFPIKKICTDFIYSEGILIGSIEISLHEINGYYNGGFPINEDALEYLSIESRNPNVDKLRRYLQNIEYISLDIFVKKERMADKKSTIRINCELDKFFVSKIDKYYHYDTFPNEEELLSLIPIIKNELALS